MSLTCGCSLQKRNCCQTISASAILQFRPALCQHPILSAHSKAISASRRRSIEKNNFETTACKRVMMVLSILASRARRAPLAHFLLWIIPQTPITLNPSMTARWYIAFRTGTSLSSLFFSFYGFSVNKIPQFLIVCRVNSQLP